MSQELFRAAYSFIGHLRGGLAMATIVACGGFGATPAAPTLIVSPFLRGNFVVDHTQYDTTSILATIERRWDVAPLGSRDANANDLRRSFTLGAE